MNFKEIGFLGEDIRKDRPVVSAYPDLFEGAKLLSKIAHTILMRIPTRAHDIQNVVTTSLYTRILTSYAATIQLAETGLSADAGGCARTALEAHFFLRKCIQDPKWAATFVKSDLKDKESYINGLLNISKKERKTYVREPKRMKKRLEEVKAEAKQIGSQEVIVGNIAAAVGLGATYSSAYKALSQVSTHITPTSLLPFLQTDEKNQITGFKYGPAEELADVVVFHGITALQGALDDVVTFHKIDTSDLQASNEQIRRHFDTHVKMMKDRFARPEQKY